MRRRAALVTTAALGALLTLAATLPVAAGESGSGDPPTGAEAGGVRVLDTRGVRPRPCPPVDGAHDPFVAGGCRAFAISAETTFTVRTAVGGMRFGQCLSQFELTIGADGSLWIDDLAIGGISPCNDLWPCAPAAVIARKKNRLAQPPHDQVPPWRGRLVTATADGAKGRFGLCVDTCLGRYRTAVDVEIVRDAKGMRLKATSANDQTSSFQLDAVWDLYPSARSQAVPKIDFK